MFTGVRTIWTADGGDVDPYHRRITGPLVVAHALARRLTTDRNSLSWAPGEGFDVRQLLNEGLAMDSQGPTDAIASVVRAECLRDERVADVVVKATFNRATNALSITVDGTTSEGPFTLVLGVSDLSVEVLRIS